MKLKNNKVSNIKIAYIGGGSRNWAWGLMSDLTLYDDIKGDVYLYDIDYDAAKKNEIIGNRYKEIKNSKTVWKYHAVKTIDEALKGADFVIISILPATFDEMESDVHAPEKYGIYQSVGDSTGPGGILRAMRTIPMYEYFARKIKQHCPNAWVINYTNPMTLCVRTLYRVFPKIKAFGCCHEVFGTQEFLTKVVKKNIKVVKNITRKDIKINVLGVNHFTWFTKASYKDIDLFPIYKNFVKKYKNKGFNSTGNIFDNWKTNTFKYDEMVKMDLFDKYGYIAAAGDRHLVEFVNGKWYLASPSRVKEMHFGLTTVAWRKKDLKRRLKKAKAMSTYKCKMKLRYTGEEGVHQIRAILGLEDLITNVNLPNNGQIPNLPRNAVVETNAKFTKNNVRPINAGKIPSKIYPLISRISLEQEKLNKAIAKRNLEEIFECFAKDPLVTCLKKDARKLFKEMMENTKKYLTMYDIKSFK